MTLHRLLQSSEVKISFLKAYLYFNVQQYPVTVSKHAKI